MNYNLSYQIILPAAFPEGNYTPHGYIDNPYHSMVFNRSGVIRSVPPLGFGWWRRNFKGSYGGADRDHINYLSFLLMSLAIDDKVFIRSNDFSNHGIKLFSRYHTKNLISYDWQYNSIDFSLKYFLPTENSLVCLVELHNSGEAKKDVFIHATNLYGLWETCWWGSDGLSANYSQEFDASISKIWAYGDVFVLGSNLKSIGHKSTDSENQWRKWLRKNDLTSVAGTTTFGSGPMQMIQTYMLKVPSQGFTSALICLSRGKNEAQAIQELQTTLRDALTILKEQLAEDELFWSKCPVLQGNWPETWKHGWVYDWETIRMNVRRPIGIYKHPWDAMQVHSPRAVLGETSLDMMMLSYADPELAKQVIYGTFADATMPNVPCSREDGSVNMISANGSECGTAPMWGFPFHVIKSIYTMTRDDGWIKRLYPYLKAYIEWWLENRTDQEGWLHCNNSWESGQDGSRRFLISRGDEGAVVNFIRTVDVEASMAEAMNNMVLFAKIAGKIDDQNYWTKLANRRIKNTQGMFVNGLFRDFDARVNQPIVLEDYFDVMMLSPLTCRIATSEQVKAIKPMFQYFKDHSQPWLEWPPLVFTFCEAAWYADMRMVAAEVVANIADRIYQRTDSSVILHEDKDDSFSYRIPGVANEFWPVPEIPAGGENYGWGATLPMHIIRNIIGYQETDKLSDIEFFLAPALPERLSIPGKTYTITNLAFRGIKTEVTLQVRDSDQIIIDLKYESPGAVSVKILNRNENIISTQPEKKGNNFISFEGKNGDIYVIRFE